MTTEQRNFLIQLLNHTKEVEIQSAIEGLYVIDDYGTTSDHLDPKDIKVVQDKLQDIINLVSIDS